MPNLETKFVAANTLISLDRGQGQLLLTDPRLPKMERELAAVRHKHFAAQRRRDKLALQRRDVELREEMAGVLVDGGMSGDASHKLAAWDPYDQNNSAAFFDPEWVYGITNGFDVILGNPPYRQIQNFSGQTEQKSWEQQNYATYSKTGDVYYLFYERGFNLLAQDGVLVYISSNQWLRVASGAKLRGFLAMQTDPQLIIDFGNVQVFEAATVNTNILLIKNTQQTDGLKSLNTVRIQDDFTSNTDIEVYSQQKMIRLSDLSSESWIISSPVESAIRKKMEHIGTPLKDWDITIKYGIKTGRDRAFIINSSKREELIKRDPKCADIIMPVLRGRDIKRYKYDHDGLWLINTHNGYGNIPPINVKQDYHAIWLHLQQINKATNKAVEIRQDQGRHWTNLRNCAYIRNFDTEKICWGNLALSAQFSLVEAGMYISAPSPLITPASRYVLAVLNSKLGDFYIRSVGVTRSGGYLEYKPMFVKELPVPYIKSNAQKSYETLVDEILDAKNKGEDSKKLEAKIDRLVYQLYDLTDKEIAVVESEVKRNGQ